MYNYLFRRLFRSLGEPASVVSGESGLFSGIIVVFKRELISSAEEESLSTPNKDAN